MIRGTKQRPDRSLNIKIFGLKKDFPIKDYLKKNGWDYSLVCCKCGNPIYIDKSYSPHVKGKQWSTAECHCKIPYAAAIRW